MAGVGKTAFAVHAAHQLAPRFPAGQIFLPLHGHTPGQRPVDPGDALASLGRCALAAGHTAEAADKLRQALEIFQRIGAAEAADVSAELEALTDAWPAAHRS